MKIAIVGGGALGTFFAAILAPRHDVTILEARPEVVAALQRDGAAVDGEAPQRVEATSDAAAVFGTALLFVFVKAHETLRALRPFAGKLNPATPIVSLQNGIGNEDAIKTALGGSVPLVLGVTTEAALSVAPGRSQRLGAGTTVLGSGGASDEIVARVRELVTDAGLHASTVYDIRPHLWGKLIANAAINPVSALLDAENEVVVRDTDASELAHSIAREGARVAAALRVQLPFADPWAYVREVVSNTAHTRNSMALDLEAGRPTEIDYINGAIAAIGRRVEVHTPYNNAMVRLIKARETLGAR